jgi:hypothetical protein
VFSLRTATAAHVIRQVHCKVTGVVTRAIDQAGSAASQERQPDHVQSRRNDSALVADATLVVENRQVDPRMVRPARTSSRSLSRRVFEGLNPFEFDLRTFSVLQGAVPGLTTTPLPDGVSNPVGTP